MERLNNLGKLRDRRRELRRNQTEQEKILWWHLKDRNFGYKFKRQYSIGGYIIDFYCPEKKLAVEVDGEIHDTSEAQEYDKIRNEFIRNAGCLVLRFPNSELDKNIYTVLTKIKEKLENM